MKILQVSSAEQIGGGEVHLVDLCHALVQRGHEVHLAARPHGPLGDRLAPSGITLHRVSLRNSLDMVSARRIGNIVRDQQIDILHGHLARDYPVCCAARRFAASGQLVLTRHHYLPIKGNWAYRRLFRQVGRVIAVSESVRQGLIGSLDLPPHQVIVIPNWVDLGPYGELPSPEQARARFSLQGSHVVGMVGQITPAKGQEEFVRAAARIASWRDDVLFIIAGEEQEKRRRFTSHLRRLAGDLKLEQRLRFAGWVEDLPSLFAALTVLVVPSWSEAFSITLIQAMAAGLPVIASNVGGPAEIVKDGVTGLLVPPRQVEALTQAVGRMLDDLDLRTRLGAAGRDDVRARFERERVIDRIESVYVDLLERDRRSVAERWGPPPR